LDVSGTLQQNIFRHKTSYVHRILRRRIRRSVGMLNFSEFLYRSSVPEHGGKKINPFIDSLVSYNLCSIEFS